VKDLTADEEGRVRVALRYLRSRAGRWSEVAKSVGFSKRTLHNIMYDGRTVTASLAFRTAKLAAVSVDDLLAGTWLPPGMCSHCGCTNVPDR
jgi:hypothetical protein